MSNFDSRYFLRIISLKATHQRNSTESASRPRFTIYAWALCIGHWIYKKCRFLLIDRKWRSVVSDEVVKLASSLQLHFPCQNGLLFFGKEYELSSKQDKICHSFTNSNHKGILDDFYPSGSAIVRARTFLESLITDWHTNSSNETLHLTMQLQDDV